MKKNTQTQLQIFNQISKEMDIVYHKYAQKCGLSDTAFWILYSLLEEERSFTQRDFCGNWSFPPQTVNSALTSLKNRGILSLEPVPGNKKNKWIRLTEEGKKHAEEIVCPLMEAECASFQALPEQECNIMLTATQKYVSNLREKLEDLKSE